MSAQKRHLGFYAVLASIVASLPNPLPAQDDGINWLGDYAQAIRQAKETRKPIFVEFRCEA
jgi:hypothetical protein